MEKKKQLSFQCGSSQTAYETIRGKAGFSMCVHYFVHSLHAVFGVETGFRIGGNTDTAHLCNSYRQQH